MKAFLIYCTLYKIPMRIVSVQVNLKEAIWGYFLICSILFTFKVRPLQGLTVTYVIVVASDSKIAFTFQDK